MFSQLIGMAYALEVQLGPWPFLQLLADPRIEAETADDDAWAITLVNGSAAIASWQQDAAWTGARDYMDSLPLARSGSGLRSRSGFLP